MISYVPGLFHYLFIYIYIIFLFHQVVAEVISSHLQLLRAIITVEMVIFHSLSQGVMVSWFPDHLLPNQCHLLHSDVRDPWRSGWWLMVGDIGSSYHELFRDVSAMFKETTNNTMR